MIKDFVSVIMTAFNEEKYIAQSINSILGQTYKNFELIIVDDGSTDATPSIIESFDDERICYYRLGENVGVGAAHAFAIEKAKGEFIAIADADDIHHPERILKQLLYLKEHKNIGVVDSYVRYFADNDEVKNTPRYKYITNVRQKHIDRVVTTNDYKRSLYWFCSVVHSASMFYRELMTQVNYSDLTVSEDYEIFYKMNKMRVEFAKVPEVLVQVRITPNSTTLAQESNLIRNFLNVKVEELNQIFEKKENIYVWGTGHGGIETARVLKESNVLIDGFLDNNKQKIGEIIDNIRVVDYREITIENSGIIIASSVGKFEIVDQLEDLGFNEFDDFLVLL
ncbi:glycosyltransferase [Lysinibacillus fusiformis]|uniref:glycosyltransferase family 2 protein n=1 Tax=Lysinibacillus fusiformis TaxID=28031 RepID=UPI001F4EECF3|nr:glycosyltransferase family 2 protein [Lysinibacillus fusiformis]MCK1986508.1 glycosyltransferase [Lysinibacillus fusiformis]